jgi:superfamily I DNA/RNA helicase
VTLGDARFSEEFYRDEWELVVQEHGLTSFDAYRDASRAGRGQRLSRKDRADVWKVMEEYAGYLEKERLSEPIDAMRDAGDLIERDKLRLPYRAVVVDEAQDMSTTAFRLLRLAAGDDHKDDLFIVGDGHQRIYRRKVVLKKAGVNIVGRSNRLRINYRTTDEIRRYAVSILSGVKVDDLDEGVDAQAGYRSLVHGQPPLVRTFKTFDDEVKFIAEEARRGDTRRACLVVRYNALLDRYRAALDELQVPTYKLSREKAEDLSREGLRLATMHRVKGLEFDRMFVAGLGEGIVPYARAIASDDEAAREERVLMERALFSVAATRAKTSLILTCNGPPSPWLPATR